MAIIICRTPTSLTTCLSVKSLKTTIKTFLEVLKRYLEQITTLGERYVNKIKAAIWLHKGFSHNI